MTNKKVYRLQAEVCKALAHGLRIEIIDLLEDGELGFGELLEKTGAPKSNLSQHLSVMVEKGILVQRRDGVNVFYKLLTPKVAKACRLMREVLIERLEKQSELLNDFQSKA